MVTQSGVPWPVCCVLEDGADDRNPYNAQMCVLKSCLFRPEPRFWLKRSSRAIAAQPRAREQRLPAVARSACRGGAGMFSGRPWAGMAWHQPNTVHYYGSLGAA